MADQNIKVIIDAQNKTGGAFDSLNNQLKTTETRMASLTAISSKLRTAGAVGFAAFAGVAATSLKAFADAESQTVITNQNLQNTLNGISGDTLKNLQTQLGNTTDTFGALKKAASDAGDSAVNLGFDDEEAARSFSTLFTRTKDVKVANEQLGVAMDLARFKNIGLKEATDALSKLQAGSTKELKLMNIAVEDGATVMDNFKKVQDQTSGSAENFAKTTSGAMEIIKVKSDTLRESIGGALKPAFDKLKETLVPIVQKFTDWAQAHPELVSKIILIGGAIAGLLLVLGTLAPLIMGAITVFTLLASPITLIIALIAGLVLGILYLANHWDQIKERIVKAWDDFKTRMGEKIMAVKAWMDKLGEWFKKLGQDIVNFFKPVTDLIDNLIQKVENLINKVKTGVGKVLGGKSGGGNSVTSVNDAVISPDGRIVSTHPDDWLVATKNPSSLGGNRNAGVVVNIQYPMFLGPEYVQSVSRQIMDTLKNDLRLSS